MSYLFSAYLAPSPWLAELNKLHALFIGVNHGRVHNRGDTFIRPIQCPAGLATDLQLVHNKGICNHRYFLSCVKDDGISRAPISRVTRRMSACLGTHPACLLYLPSSLACLRAYLSAYLPTNQIFLPTLPTCLLPVYLCPSIFKTSLVVFPPGAMCFSRRKEFSEHVSAKHVISDKVCHSCCFAFSVVLGVHKFFCWGYLSDQGEGNVHHLGNAVHAVHTQCEVLDAGKYSDPTSGPF